MTDRELLEQALKALEQAIMDFGVLKDRVGLLYGSGCQRSRLYNKAKEDADHALRAISAQLQSLGEKN